MPEESWSGLNRLLRILSSNISRGSELLSEYVARISKSYPMSTVLLFGSRARGDYLPYSDYDVAVVMNDASDERDVMTKIRGLKPEGLPLDLTLLSISDLNDQVIRDMLRGCIVLYDGLGIGNELTKLGCRAASH